MKHTLIFDAILFTCSVFFPALFTSNPFIIVTVSGFIYFSVWQFLERRTPYKKPITILRKDFEHVVYRLHYEINRSNKRERRQ